MISGLIIDGEVAEIEAEIVIDDSTLRSLPPVPAAPDVRERLRLIEVEKRSAYQQMHRLMSDIGTLKSRQEAHQRDKELAQIDAMYRLALLAEYRSGEGAAKVLRIGVMAALVAHALGCDDDYCDQLQMAAPLHDIGEIGLPETLLRVPVFNIAEREMMEHHCRLGASLLEGSVVPEMRMAAAIALAHHEHFDGGGYPAGLACNEIPLAARIVAVIDCFDALTTDRPVRGAHLVHHAVPMVLAGSGTQFDPAVCKAFQRVSELLLIVRWGLDENNPRPELAEWLDKPPVAGFWRGFV